MTLLGPVMCDRQAPGFGRIVPRDAVMERIPNGVMGLRPAPNP